MKSHRPTGFRFVPIPMSLNDLEQCTLIALILRFSPNSIALLADYVTVVEFVQLSAPPVQNLWVPDPQHLYPVLSFFGPLMMQQTFSMQVSPLWSLQGSVHARKSEKAQVFDNFDANFLELRNDGRNQNLIFIEGGNLCRNLLKPAKLTPRYAARGRQTCSISLSYHSKPEVEFAKILTTFFTAHRALQSAI